MTGNTVERQKLIDVVSTLPDEILPELSDFLDYLRYKSIQQKEASNNPANFLASIAGIGSSSQQDIAERDEEILRSEISPIYGWNLKQSDAQ
jgi:hypothetical protein